MSKIEKLINDTNASYRDISAGDAKNTDLFLDKEHRAFFGDQTDIHVRLHKKNLAQAILFIASILPRKYDCSSIHHKILFSNDFVIDNLLKLDGFFINGDEKIVSWHIRQGTEQKNGKIDERFYLNNLIQEYTYTTKNGNVDKAKFTIRDYLAGGYSRIEFVSNDDGIFDFFVYNSTEKHLENNSDKDVFDSNSLTLPYNRIVFGAPGTGKTFIINNEAEKHFGTTIDITPKDIWQNISEEIQKSDKTAASLFAIGFKYSVALKNENPKSLVQKFKITYDGAYAINQGIRVVDFYNKLPEYDADKIDAIISEQLEKLKNEHFLMQAGSAAIGLKYSEYFYGKSTGDIISDLNLSKTSSQASWIWNGAQSANYFEDSVEEKTTRRYERVTFHPNYSYAQFVGTYKPVQDKNDNTAIRYEYIPGPFMRVYVQAMKAKQVGLNDDFLLIIEEINRANVAAVFGDVFQLLDRKNGVSEYPIAASEDIKKYLTENGIDDCEELRIPNNMFIWATMNSADQGVFPMDTAFKRRWEFEYIGIDENEDGIKDYDIPLQKNADGSHEWVKWNDLRHSINNKLTEMKINEDKLLGPYFISEEKLKLVEGKNEENATDIVKSFKSKVLMYLFEDAVKMRPGDLFDENAIGRLRFSDICQKFDEIGQGIFNFKK